MTAVIERAKRPPSRHHDDAEPDETTALLVDAIDNNPEVRAAILRLFASNRATPAARARRTTTREPRGR